jgi:hypothetical protein
VDLFQPEVLHLTTKRVISDTQIRIGKLFEEVTHMDLAEKIESIESRLTTLEGLMSTKRSVPELVDSEGASERAPKGPSAGLRALISDQFFARKRFLEEVRTALGERGLFYSSQAVHMALVRESRRDGRLVALREQGRKFYAERK